MHSFRRRRKGFTLIELLIVIEIISILGAMSVPGIVGSRRAANETSAVGSLRTINAVESSYRTSNGIYGTLAQLRASRLIDASLGGATSAATARSGYYFTLQGITTAQYWIVATAANSSAGGQQFYSDEVGTIFAARNGATPPSADTDGTPPSAEFTQIGK